MPDFKRRIRIKCEPRHPFSAGIDIRDISTGNVIGGIKEAKIYLKAGEVNRGELIYADRDGNTRKTEQVEVPEVDLTVFEPWNRDDIRDLLVDALIVHGSHHKQWYLWQLADLLGFHLDIDADKGIAP